MLPGWFGFGTAVTLWLEGGGAIDELRRMYRTWPFFRTMLSNLEMVLAKTDLVRISRLSVVPLTAAQYERALKHAGTKP